MNKRMSSVNEEHEKWTSKINEKTMLLYRA